LDWSVLVTISVEVFIVAFESGMFLQGCVDALARQTWHSFKAVIIDNASTDGSVSGLVLPDQRFSVLTVGYNSGFAAANNIGVRQSSADFVVLLNPDTVVEDDWLRTMIEVAQHDPQVASVGSVQRRMSDPTILDGLGDVWHVAGLAWRTWEGRPWPHAVGDVEIFGPCGASALYRREAFLAVGGFDERYFCYFEDVDLALRLRLAGFRSVRAGRSVILHAGSGITGRLSDFTIYHGHRNRIWTFLKNCPAPIFLPMLIYHIVFNMLYLLVAIRRGFWRPVCRAYYDAWKGRAPFLEERSHRKRLVTIWKYLRFSAWTPWSPIFRGD
jgi:N-acetylglucosaminyl-diphospho-decaprenol L-rhamnosyltransferase